jgi:hypothetical protein
MELILLSSDQVRGATNQLRGVYFNKRRKHEGERSHSRRLSSIKKDIVVSFF